jgi:hypothetical protein
MPGVAARPYRQTARAEATQDLRSRIVQAFLSALKGTSKNSLPRRDRNEIHSDGKQS